MSQPQKPVVNSGTNLAGAISLEGGMDFGGLEDVKARGYWEQVWRRLKRDKIAIAGGVVIVLMLLTAFAGAPIAKHLLGHGPNDQNVSYAVDDSLVPIGPLKTVPSPTGVGSWHMFLGASDTLGRDEFLRLLYGAQVSFEVALLSTIGSMFIGVLMGAMAGYFRGWVDTIVSRLTEITMAFPFLLFVIALASTVGSQLDNVTFGVFGRGVVTLVLVFSVFGWFYPARIMRAVVLSLREKEFIEAARMVGSSDWRIIRSHVLPHLLAPIIVFSTLSVASFILGEAGLSFLGVGIKLPTASWGNLLDSAKDFYSQQPTLILWPGLLVLITTLSFNLLGDGLRDAFDPRAQH